MSIRQVWKYTKNQSTTSHNINFSHLSREINKSKWQNIDTNTTMELNFSAGPSVTVFV